MRNDDDKMKTFAQLVACLVLLASLFVSSTLSMIYGWGVQPRSWWWIVGGWLWIAVSQLMLKAIK